MTRFEQGEFVRELAHGIVSGIVEAIDGGKVSENWDGHELRQLLADKTAESVSRVFRDGRSARVKDYKDAKLMANL